MPANSRDHARRHALPPRIPRASSAQIEQAKRYLRRRRAAFALLLALASPPVVYALRDPRCRTAPRVVIERARVLHFDEGPARDTTLTVVVTDAGAWFSTSPGAEMCR